MCQIFFSGAYSHI